MKNPLPFLSGGMPDRAHALQAVHLTRTDGTTLALDPAATRLHFREEHPNVDRMLDDWGAICEVYQNASDSYLTITGVALHAGDSITLAYGDRPALTLRVLDVEQGRARVAWAAVPGEKPGQVAGMEP